MHDGQGGRPKFYDERDIVGEPLPSVHDADHIHVTTSLSFCRPAASPSRRDSGFVTLSGGLLAYGRSRAVRAAGCHRYGTSRICLIGPPALNPGPSRDRCGTTAGHMSSGSAPDTPEQPADLCFPSWGGEDSNLRPADYEFDLAGRGDQPKSAGTGPDQQL